MRRRISTVLAVMAAFALSGCFGHNFPLTDRFLYADTASAAAADHAELVVDPNGTIYPDGWCAYVARGCAGPIKPPRRWAADSLLNQTVLAKHPDPALRHLIDAEEARQLDQIAAFGQNKRRIFIFIHGFNSKVAESNEPFGAIEDRIDKRPGDGFIRFHWDGLTATGIFPAKIWFAAVGNSQLAGARGLRRVLERFSGKQIYLISHSRGASVILSALGNPVYDPAFLDSSAALASNWGADGQAFLLPPARATDRGNHLHVLMMAAAIGRIDFCDASEQPTVAKDGCSKLRDLGSDVESFRYTVNTGDPVLRKYVGLSARLNPTNFGQNPEIGRAINDEKYHFMKQYLTDPPRLKHKFALYVADQTFKRMLADEGILKP